MSEEKPRNILIQLIFTLLVFLATLILALVFRETLRETLLVPLLYLVWVGNLAFKSLDQSCIWVAALMVALAIGMGYRRRAKTPLESPQTILRRPPPAGRIQFWQSQLGVRRGLTSDQRLTAWEARRLFINLLAYREHTNAEQIKKQLSRGELTLPAEIRAHLALEDNGSRPEQPIPPLERLRQMVIEYLNLPDRGAASRPDPKWEKVADYLESLMEVEHDIRNR